MTTETRKDEVERAIAVLADRLTHEHYNNKETAVYGSYMSEDRSTDNDPEYLLEETRWNLTLHGVKAHVIGHELLDEAVALGIINGYVVLLEDNNDYFGFVEIFVSEEQMLKNRSIQTAFWL